MDVDIGNRSLKQLRQLLLRQPNSFIYKTYIQLNLPVFALVDNKLALVVTTRYALNEAGSGFNFALLPVDGWRVSLGGSYIDAKYVKFGANLPGGFQVINGAVPASRFRISSRLSLLPGSGSKVAIRAARQAARGRRAGQRCSVEICPWRTFFSCTEFSL